MIDIIKHEITVKYKDADAVLSKFYMDEMDGIDLLPHMKPIDDQIILINAILDILNRPDCRLLPLDDERRELQVLGYKLYRAQWDAVHAM